ncbi:hypothetical protein WISP_01017 [Willisornis vidua]|uniref:SUGP1 protein n=1 Tax=Willisornis vidua TaxID=1566151 RepID=A0ABQ9E154_9PASS|nr:hypothetical protein WISP_01017 [Willisornis vidua]
MQQMYDMIMKHKRAMQEMQMMWEKAIQQHQHGYDSDEEVDSELGTWEHQLRRMEMDKTREWAEQLTQMGRGKHFIGDFLPPDELEKFMETFKALKVTQQGLPGVVATLPRPGWRREAPGRPESLFQGLKGLQESWRGIWDKGWRDRTQGMASHCH